MTTHTDFKDFNFKLAVIEVLMYRKKLLMPEFDIYTFVKQHKARKIDIEKEGYEVIPECRQYFEDLVIPQELLLQVESINQGSHDVYHQIVHFWDGEDDAFNISSTDDLALVPNLKRIVLLYDNGKMLKEFEAKGIQTEYL